MIKEGGWSPPGCDSPRSALLSWQNDQEHFWAKGTICLLHKIMTSHIEISLNSLSSTCTYNSLSKNSLCITPYLSKQWSPSPSSSTLASKTVWALVILFSSPCSDIVSESYWNPKDLLAPLMMVFKICGLVSQVWMIYSQIVTLWSSCLSVRLWRTNFTEIFLFTVSVWRIWWFVSQSVGCWSHKF